MTHPLELLAMKCEGASGPDRYLDVEICIAACIVDSSIDPRAIENMRADTDDDGWVLYEHDGENYTDSANSFTASLDAALTLVPEGWWLTLDRYAISDNPSSEIALLTWRVWLKYLAGDVDGDGPCGLVTKFATGATPALALTAAALRARAALSKDQPL